MCFAGTLIHETSTEDRQTDIWIVRNLRFALSTSSFAICGLGLPVSCLNRCGPTAHMPCGCLIYRQLPPARFHSTDLRPTGPELTCLSCLQSKLPAASWNLRMYHPAFSRILIAKSNEHAAAILLSTEAPVGSWLRDSPKPKGEGEEEGARCVDG